MSSRYSNGGRYTGGSGSGTARQDGVQDAGTPRGREAGQLSAEEIAAILAQSYSGRVVTGMEDEREDSADSRSAEGKDTAEKEREARRKKRVQEMRRRKRRQEQMRRLMLPCIAAAAVCVILAGLGIGSLVRKHGDRQNTLPPEGSNEFVLNGENEDSSDHSGTDEDSSDGSVPDGDSPNSTGTADREITYAGSLNVAGCYVGSTIAESLAEELALADSLIVRTLGGRSAEPPLAAAADGAASPDGEVMSENVVFIDVEAGRILGQRGADTRIPPASMTKILTVLVAAEHITDPDDTFVITQDIVDYSFVNHCSNAGFEVGEKVTVRDLFYGTVLPSGGEAAVALAVYAAGSQEAFVAPSLSPSPSWTW